MSASLTSVPSALRRDLVQALRVIVKTPAVSLIAILSLGLGVAANTTVFSVVDAFLLRPLPYPEADALVLLHQNPRGRSDAQNPVSPATFFDWRQSANAFEAVEAVRFGTVDLSGLDRPEQLSASWVTPGMFDLAGSDPVAGRTFSADEGAPGQSRVVVISERFQTRRLAGVTDIVGHVLELDGEDHTVVGVMPETFDFILGSVDLWIADDLSARRDDRLDTDLLVVARLRDADGLGAARAEMTVLAERLANRYPEALDGVGVHVQRLRDLFPGPTDTQLVKTLMIVVLMVLLIACANVGSLLLSKSDARAKEMAVRVALGASKTRLMRQLLTESVVMALVAGIVGMGFGWLGVRMSAGAIPSIMPSMFVPRFDASVIAFSVAVSVLAGLAFGIGPALQAVRGQLGSALVERSRGGTAGRDRKRLLAGFVVAEFALALAILVGAAVLTDLFDARLSVDPGFTASGVLTAELPLSEHRFADDAALARFAGTLEDDLAALPGVTAASITTRLPRARESGRVEIELDGRPTERGDERTALALAVGAEYFQTLEIELLRGRGFARTDTTETARVAVVDTRFADRYFDGESPLGERVEVGDETWEIVGLVPNVAQERMSGLTPARPTLYLPFAQRPQPRLRAVLRTTGDPYALRESLQSTVWALAADQPVATVISLEDHVTTELAGPATISKILYFVGLLALVLSSLGIYGVMAFRVTQQRAEIGVRMALGAGPARVQGRVTRQGAVLAGLGLAIGVPLAIGIVFMVNGMLGAATSDGMTPAGGLGLAPVARVIAILVGAGLLACWLPALKATRIDPATVLQET